MLVRDLRLLWVCGWPVECDGCGLDSDSSGPFCWEEVGYCGSFVDIWELISCVCVEDAKFRFARLMRVYELRILSVLDS
jgi:hypothetical protein